MKRVLVDWFELTEELPDADVVVLITLEDGEVWTGFIGENGEWRNICAARLPKPPIFWAHLPHPPHRASWPKQEEAGQL